MVEEDVSTKAHNIRSRVLNYAIIIEMELANFIRDYFIENDDKKIKFGEWILGKEFFTFEQKIQIFQKIIGENINLEIFVLGKGEYNLGQNKKGLMRKIRYMQEIRNVIAHQHPFRDEGNNEIAIKYNFNGKKKEIILNESFSNNFFKEYCEVSDILRYVSNELFKKQ